MLGVSGRVVWGLPLIIDRRRLMRRPCKRWRHKTSPRTHLETGRVSFAHHSPLLCDLWEHGRCKGKAKLLAVARLQLCTQRVSMDSSSPGGTAPSVHLHPVSLPCLATPDSLSPTHRSTAIDTATSAIESNVASNID